MFTRRAGLAETPAYDRSVSDRAGKAMLVCGALAIVFAVKVLRGAFFMMTYRTNDVALAGVAAVLGSGLIAVGATKLGQRWIGLGVALAILGGGAWYGMSRIDESDRGRRAAHQDFAVEERLYAACLGGTIPQAAPLAELGHGIRKVLFLEKWDANNRPRALVPDARWKPADVADAQLVGCLVTGSDIVETCPSGIARRRRKVEAKLVEARTGKVIAEQVTYGGLPAACSMAGARSTDLEGERPDDDEILRWARPFVVGAEAVP